MPRGDLEGRIGPNPSCEGTDSMDVSKTSLRGGGIIVKGPALTVMCGAVTLRVMNYKQQGLLLNLLLTHSGGGFARV